MQSRWLDAGAGRANAQKEYMLQLKDKINSPELLAVAFKKPFFTGIPSKSKMKYLSGRWFEEIPDSELGTFDVITDFFGPVSYGKDSLEIVNKYLRLLNAGGEIFISMPMNAAVLSTERSKVVSLSEWIKMQLEVSANYEVEISHTRILKIKYLQGPAIQLSRIKQTSFKSGLPPERFYIE